MKVEYAMENNCFIVITNIFVNCLFKNVLIVNMHMQVCTLLFFQISFFFVHKIENFTVELCLMLTRTRYSVPAKPTSMYTLSKNTINNNTFILSSDYEDLDFYC